MLFRLITTPPWLQLWVRCSMRSKCGSRKCQQAAELAQTCSANGRGNRTPTKIKAPGLVFSSALAASRRWFDPSLQFQELFSGNLPSPHARIVWSATSNGSPIHSPRHRHSDACQTAGCPARPWRAGRPAIAARAKCNQTEKGQQHAKSA